MDFNENLQDIWDLNKEKSPDKTVRNINAKNRHGFTEIMGILKFVCIESRIIQAIESLGDDSDSFADKMENYNRICLNKCIFNLI